jgi:hypothetical protein
MKLVRHYLCFLGFAALAYPGVITSDFNPDNITYQGGWGIYGADNSVSPGAFNSMAMAFTPTAPSLLTSIDVAISLNSGTNSVS